MYIATHHSLNSDFTCFNVYDSDGVVSDVEDEDEGLDDSDIDPNAVLSDPSSSDSYDEYGEYAIE